MSIRYTSDKDTLIIAHEEVTLACYKEQIAAYTPRFAALGITPRVSLVWYNLHDGRSADHRLPFVRGYSCYVSCDLWRDGKLLAVRNEQNTASQTLGAIWTISLIYKRLFRQSEVVLDARTDGIAEEMEALLQKAAKA